MDCKAWENEISRREADLLDAGQQKALEAHIVGCSACREVSDRVRQGIRAMSAMPITPAPKSFLEDSWRRIQKASLPTPSGPMDRLKRWFEGLSQPPMWLPLGAAAAVVLAITVIPGIRDPGAPVAHVAQYRILAQDGAVKIVPTPAGGAILSTQGGRLEVEHAGRAKYVLAGNGNTLQIGLGRPDAIELSAGAAEVSVQADPARPYAVEIAGARVVVTGTIFRLKAGQPAQVELVEGKIRLMGPDWSRELAPGDKVSWTDAGPVGAAPKASGQGARGELPSSVKPARAKASGVQGKALAEYRDPARPPRASASGVQGEALVEYRDPARPPRASPIASPAPATGAGEIETGSSQQLNDPFQGR